MVLGTSDAVAHGAFPLHVQVHKLTTGIVCRGFTCLLQVQHKSWEPLRNHSPCWALSSVLLLDSSVVSEKQKTPGKVEPFKLPSLMT